MVNVPVDHGWHVVLDRTHVYSSMWASPSLDQRVGTKAHPALTQRLPNVIKESESIIATAFVASPVVTHKSGMYRREQALPFAVWRHTRICRIFNVLPIPRRHVIGSDEVVATTNVD